MSLRDRLTENSLTIEAATAGVIREHDIEAMCKLADHVYALYYGKGYTGLVPPWAKEEFKEHDTEIGKLLRDIYE